MRYSGYRFDSSRTRPLGTGTRWVRMTAVRPVASGSANSWSKAPGRMERAATGCRKKVLTSAKSSAQAVR